MPKKHTFEKGKLAAGFSLVEEVEGKCRTIRLDSAVYRVGVYAPMYMDNMLVCQGMHKSAEALDRKIRRDVRNAIERGATRVSVWYRGRV